MFDRLIAHYELLTTFLFDAPDRYFDDIPRLIIALFNSLQRALTANGARTTARFDFPPKIYLTTQTPRFTIFLFYSSLFFLVFLLRQDDNAEKVRP